MEKLPKMEECEMTNELRKEVEGKIGSVVGTLWGPCRVLEVFRNEEDGVEYVLLDEGGEEFTVELSEWHDCLQ